VVSWKGFHFAHVIDGNRMLTAYINDWKLDGLAVAIAQSDLL
jgi:hypothetical protein